MTSFLTTNGFVSMDWQIAENWTGLPSAGIMFLALAVAGGGVATTAGGVKLLRLFALYKHGARELERLVHPSSIGGTGRTARRFRREGAYITWIFLMLFLVGIAVISAGLATTGVSFEHSIALAIATVTNVGPVATMLDHTIQYSNQNPHALGILSVAMVFGRVEVLALIALMNPAYWRE